jgi:hypothetical protein
MLSEYLIIIVRVIIQFDQVTDSALLKDFQTMLGGILTVWRR